MSELSMIKLLNTNDKRENFNSIRERGETLLIEKRAKSHFLKNMQARKQWNYIFKVLEETRIHSN